MKFYQIPLTEDTVQELKEYWCITEVDERKSEAQFRRVLEYYVKQQLGKLWLRGKIKGVYGEIPDLKPESLSTKIEIDRRNEK